MLDWLAELLGLPGDSVSGGPGGGVIQDSASSAVLVALTAAMHRATGGAWRTSGVAGAGWLRRRPGAGLAAGDSRLVQSRSTRLCLGAGALECG